MAASHVQHMQQALERMNVKFHDVITSLTGVSGLKVVRAILQGEREPQRLLELCDRQIQKNKAAAVCESLRGTWKSEHLFALRQALQGWEFYQAQIKECDEAIAAVLRESAGPDDPDSPSPRAHKDLRNNASQITGLHGMLMKLCGQRDPTALPGITSITPSCSSSVRSARTSRAGPRPNTSPPGRALRQVLAKVANAADTLPDSAIALDASSAPSRRVWRAVWTKPSAGSTAVCVHVAAGWSPIRRWPGKSPSCSGKLWCTE